MARVFTDGAEFGDVLFWDVATSTTASNTYARTGTYSYSIRTAQKNITGIAEFYLRFGFYAPSAITSVIMVAFRNSGTTLCDLYIGADSKLNARVNAAVVDTSDSAISAGSWHLIEAYLKVADAGNFNGKIDGVQELTYAGDTKPGSATTIDNLYASYGSAQYWDDLALNDVSGGVDDSWCGDGRIEILTPMTGGTYQWTGSDGDSVDNFEMVNDIPPNSDTDYVKDSTAGHQDIYTLSDFTGTGKVPLRIWPECRAKDNDVSGGQIKLGFKTVGGTTHLSATARTLSGNYARVVGDEETVTPDDSAAWEDADLDGLQFVVECE